MLQFLTDCKCINLLTCPRAAQHVKRCVYRVLQWDIYGGRLENQFGKNTIAFDTARSKKKSFGSDMNYQSELALRLGASTFLAHLKNTRFVGTIFYFLFLEEPVL
jgi:hypothetical protein